MNVSQEEEEREYMCEGHAVVGECQREECGLFIGVGNVEALDVIREKLNGSTGDCSDPRGHQIEQIQP